MGLRFGQVCGTCRKIAPEKKDLAKNIIYINKEDIALDRIRNYEQLNEFVVSKLKNDTRNYISSIIRRNKI
ncbi:hypothetical protein AGMMS49982_19840 [Bacteroidia bacterium]|nr:hypothetical protein AGMMS49982_19840 [Bacteroidia bacterium]